MSGSQQLFSLITANTLITHTYVWNVVTCCFYETSVVKLFVDLVLLWFLSGHIGIPNIEQFGLYFAFSILTCSIGTSLLCFLRFVGTGHEYPLLAASFGFSGMLITFLMFVRQKLRNQSVHHKYWTSVTYHFAPTLYVASQFTLRLIGLRSFGEDITFTTLSLLYSWSYLKFFYKYSETDAPGDRGDDFSFVGMFPEVFLFLHHLSAKMSSRVFDLSLSDVPHCVGSIHNGVLQSHGITQYFPAFGASRAEISSASFEVEISSIDRCTIELIVKLFARTPAPSAHTAPAESLNDEANTKAKVSKTDIIAERRKARAIKVQNCLKCIEIVS